MNADELIAVLRQLTPEQRRLPLIGYDHLEELCEVTGVEQIALESPFDVDKGEVPDRPALAFAMTKTQDRRMDLEPLRPSARQGRALTPVLSRWTASACSRVEALVTRFARLRGPHVAVQASH